MLGVCVQFLALRLRGAPASRGGNVVFVVLLFF
jgi:hypothetical protein